MKRKSYFFRCQKCNKRKLQSAESFGRPGLCLDCYNNDGNPKDPDALCTCHHPRRAHARGLGACTLCYVATRLSYLAHECLRFTLRLR